MRILVPANQLTPIIDLLDALPLTGIASRARSKLLHLLRDAYTSFAEDEYALVATHATVGADGKPVVAEDGTVTLATPEAVEEFHTAHQALLTGRVEVAGATYETHARDLITLLDEATLELTGERAEAYNTLYDALTAQAAEKTQATEGGETP